MKNLQISIQILVYSYKAISPAHSQKKIINEIILWTTSTSFMRNILNLRSSSRAFFPTFFHSSFVGIFPHSFCLRFFPWWTLGSLSFFGMYLFVNLFGGLIRQTVKIESSWILKEDKILKLNMIKPEEFRKQLEKERTTR